MSDNPFPEEDAQAAEGGFGGGAVALPDPRDSGTLEVFPPARGVVSEARQMLADNVAMLDDAYRVADIVCQTPAAPARYRGKAKEGTVAIMYGAELGLPPMASLQKVINIHGMPSIEARTMKGLLKAKGFQFRTVTKTATECTIQAWEPTSDKRIDPPDEVATWTIERAQLAEYAPRPDPDNPGEWVKRRKQDGTYVVDGNMKYVTDPTGMLEAKATAEVCRAIAPEILMGLPYCTEERDDWHDDEDEPPAEEEKPRRRGRAKGVNALKDRAKAAAEKAEERAEAAADNVQDAEVVEEPQAPTASVTTAAERLAEAAGQMADGFLGYAPGVEPSTANQQIAEAQAAATQTPEAAPLGAEPSSAAPAQPAAPDEVSSPAVSGQDSDAAVPPEADAASGAAADGEPTASAAAASDPNPSSAGDDANGPAGGAKEHPAPPAEEASPAAPAPEKLSGRAKPPVADGIEMSDEVRARGERMMADLLAEGKVDADEAANVVSEIAAKMEGKYHQHSDPRDLTNRALKFVVDQLRAHKAKGDLYEYCCEAGNAAALREAGMMEAQG